VTSAVLDVSQDKPNFPSYAVFAGMLAFAGLPIYIHAPKFFVDNYGVSLAALGAVLFGLRLFDFVQDPLLGWVAERTRAYRASLVACAVALMAASMLALFAVTPPIAPLLWFALALTGLFSSFSFLTICFYAQGVSLGATLGDGHVRLATWRETGSLLGVCLAAVAPTAFLIWSDAPFVLFAATFAALALLAWWVMRQEWTSVGAQEESSWQVVLADRKARRLLLIALFNATPVAVSSTLFLFFVESRLGAAGFDGPLLLLFFLAAAASAPAWGWLARRIGARESLLIAMVLSIVAFGFVMLLGTGDVAAFAVICVASGAALGADMTLLPALFARRMAEIAPAAGQAFGIWSFVSKFTLAFAAVVLLPALEGWGFVAGEENSETVLWRLTLLYALLPCFLKLLALGLLWATPGLED